MKILNLVILLYVASIITLGAVYIRAGQDITTTGVVTVGGIDNNLILSTDEYDYQVTSKGTGLLLRKHLGRTVTVIGRVWIDAEGWRRITIRRILKVWLQDA